MSRAAGKPIAPGQVRRYLSLGIGTARRTSPSSLVDKLVLNRTDCLEELLHIFGAVVDLGIECVHDRPSQAGVNFGAPLADVRRGRGVMMQGRASVEDFALPWMLETAHAVARHAKGKDVQTLVGGTAAYHLG